MCIICNRVVLRSAHENPGFVACLLTKKEIQVCSALSLARRGAMHHSFYTQRAAQLCGALPAVAAQQEREAGRAVSPAQPGQLRSSLLPRSLQHVGARPEASASQSAVPSRLPRCDPRNLSQTRMQRVSTPHTGL